MRNVTAPTLVTLALSFVAFGCGSEAATSTSTPTADSGATSTTDSGAATTTDAGATTTTDSGATTTTDSGATTTTDSGAATTTDAGATTTTDAGATTTDSGATTTTDSGATTTTDSGAATTTDAGATRPTDSGTSASADAGTATSGATLTGLVKRVASTQPSAGGRGNVYVAVFDSDPVVNRQNARSVGNALIADADMSAATASVRYTITNLPPRSQQYFVIAFLDDNKNAPANAPAPDRGDLVSMDGFSAPKVTLAAPTSVTLDLNLTMALPF